MGASSIPISTFDESTRTRIEELRRRGDRITIEDNGVPVAAVVSIRNAEELDQWENERQKDWAALDEIRASFAGVPEEELMSEALKAIKESRDDQDRELAAALDAIRATDPNLPSDELLEIAQTAVRRAHDRIREERQLADQALRTHKEELFQSGESAVLSTHRRASAAAR